MVRHDTGLLADTAAGPRLGATGRPPPRRRLLAAAISSAVLLAGLAGPAPAQSFPAVLPLATLNGSDGFRIRGEFAGDYSGFALADAGDINGDGIDDIVVGAYFASPSGSYSGRTYVVFGSAAPRPPTLLLSSLDGSNGFRLDGVAPGDFAGIFVGNAGDFNGDGIDDLAIGASGVDVGGTSRGRAYVVFGRSSGFPATVALASLDGSNGFAIAGEAAGDRLGVSLAAAGDVNGDGFGDLVLGAPEAQGNGLRSGRAYIVFGRPGPTPATLDLGALTGADGVRLLGQAAGDIAGFSVSGAGDVNGDGFDDVVIGAPAAAANGPFSGRAYLVFGRAAAFPPLLQLSSLDGGSGVRFDGEVTNDSAGQSVSAAGDVNGDGLDDLLIGAYYASHGADYAGRSYIVFGRASPFPASVPLSTLDGGTGVKIDGAASYDYSGYSVSGAGDVNGDGFDDVVIGADRSTAGAGAGRSHVVFGRGDGFPPILGLASLDGSSGFTLDGEAADDRSGFAVSGAGDVNGDGVDDLLIGSPYALLGAGRSHVVFGRRGDPIFADGFGD